MILQKLNTSRSIFAIGCFLWPILSVADVIFSENFDDQPDYFITDHSNPRNNSAFRDRGEVVPEGWDAAIGDFVGDSNLSSMEISGNLPEAIRGGKGKSLILRRRTNLAQWHGEGELAKNFFPGYEELFISFWIKFQPNWLNQGRSKIFRIGSYSPDTAVGGDYWHWLGMGFVWDYVHSSNFGVRNNLLLRGGPYPGSKLTNPKIGRQPAKYSGDQKIDGNFVYMPYDLDNNGTVDNYPRIKNLSTGKIIPNDPSYNVNHDGLFGTKWHKLEFYVKVNSTPGATDGTLAQWFDGSLVFLNKTIPWIQNDGSPDMKFTTIKFGGNDFTRNFLQENSGIDRIEWHAIDDITVLDMLPASHSLKGNIPPMAPSKIDVQ